MRVIHESGEVRIRQCRHGAMAYLRHDEHVGRALDLYGEWGEGELELLKLFIKPGSVAIDVGANLGTHATFFAQQVGPTGAVLAFEPQRFVHQLLCTNFAINGIAHARAFHAALGSAPGAITVPDIDYSAKGNFGGLALGHWAEGERVPVLTLDGFNLPQCDLVKIDVEGMELSVLQGARQTLKRLRPVVYLENNGPNGSPEVVALLVELGYSLHWHFSPFFRADNFAGVKDNVFGPLVDANMLAVPPPLAQAVKSLQSVTGPADTASQAMGRR